jgi:hypothetical protein
MDFKVTVDSDHYLVISNIRSRISNARKTYGSRIRKFNSERLNGPGAEARCVQRIYESLTESIDSEYVKEAWKALKEIITMSANITLGKIGRMQQRNHTRKAVQEYHVACGQKRRKEGT